MTEPVRLQLSRRKGFSLQALSRSVNGLPAIKVTRPSVFGNPFTLAAAREAGYLRKGDNEAVANLFLRDSFAQWVGFLPAGTTPWMGEESDRARADLLANLPRLRGHNLACFCLPELPCHVDILLPMVKQACQEVR